MTGAEPHDPVVREGQPEEVPVSWAPVQMEEPVQGQERGRELCWNACSRKAALL